MSERRSSGLRPWLSLAPVVAVVAVLLLLLPHYSMWRDEALTAQLMTGTLGDLLQTFRDTVGSEAAQPLYFVALWPWGQVFGTGEVALRLPSLAASIATAWVLFRVLRRLGVGARARGAGYVLLLPVMMWYSIEARPYALIVLLVALHLLESLRLLQGDSRTAVRLAVITFLITAAYSVAGCAAILAFFVLLWRRREAGSGEGISARVLEGLALTGSLFLVAFSVGKTGVSGVPKGRSRPLSLAYAAYEVATGRSIGFSVSELRADSLTDLLGGHLLDVMLVVLIVGALALIVWRGLSALPDAQRPALLLLAAPWVVGAASFAAYGMVTTFPLLGRHLLFALPPVFVLITVGLSTRSTAEWVAAGAVLSVTAALALAGIVFSSRYDKDDFRYLATVLRRCGLSAADTVVAAPVHGVSYYSPSFEDAPLNGAQDAVERVARGESKAAVVDVNHTDPEGVTSGRIARAEGLQVLAITDLRVISRESLLSCSRAGRR